MGAVADIFGIGGVIEVDEGPTTRTSWIGVGVAGSIALYSAILLALGMSPSFYFTDGGAPVTGNRMWNTLGWVLGAVIVPLVVVYSHQHELRRSLSPHHIRDNRIKNALGFVLVIGLLVSTIHAFLGSVTIQFGS